MPYAPIGVARGVIADVNDAEQRVRYRVRVYGVHDDDVPTSHLPWAETCPIGGKSWGDIPPWDVGDRVALLPELGSREYWFIIGGWISSPDGASDLPPEMAGDYENDRVRWCRIDRVGNMIQMSSKADEKRIRLKSGSATLDISMVDDSIVLTAEGPVKINAKKAMVTSDVSDIQSGQINIIGQGVDGTTENGAVNIFSNKDMNIFAGVGTLPPTQDGKGTLQIGQYKDSTSNPRQTNEAYVGPKTLQLGKEEAAASLSSDGFLHTDEVNLEATTQVSIKSTNGKVQIDVKDAEINATGTTNITSVGDTTIASSGGKTVLNAQTGIDVTATTGDINVTATAGKVTLKGATATAQALINASLVSIYNAHIHPTSGGPFTSAPTVPLTPTVQTVDTTAS